MKKFVFMALSLLITGVSVAQPTPNVPAAVSEMATARIGSIKGKIVESGSNAPLEYASVAIFAQQDSTLAGGAIADGKGQFTVSNLLPGAYYLEAKFVGYEGKVMQDFRISRDRSTLDIGVIELAVASESLNEINVVAQDRAVSYQIDKKVIDPSQFPTAANGTAVDILALTPSVTVDIEGNVALRGSANFSVYIDGKPTPFSAADALQQMPASQIRNIEIITNPSAKFDPDGNAGIININTKKSKFEGISGIVNAGADSNGSLNGDFLLNYRKNKLNYFVSGNLAQRVHGGHTESGTTTILTDTITTSSIGEGSRGQNSYSVKAGFDYFINSNNTLSFNAGVNGRNFDSGSEVDFIERSSAGYTLYNFTKGESAREGQNTALTLDYKKTFAVPGQELTAMVFFETGVDEESSFSNQYTNAQPRVFDSGIANWEAGDDRSLRLKADYVHPLAGQMKLSAGYQARIDRSSEWNDVKWYELENDQDVSPNSPYYNETEFMRDIHSAYLILADQRTAWGYQLGLRSEYTNRKLDYSGATNPYEYNLFDLFPSAHISFNLPAKQQMTVSYTRRIDRVRGHYLEPFVTYESKYSVRTGNPEIEDEYIDSYELGYQLPLGKRGFLSAEAYFRQTNNKIERVQSVYADNVMLSSVANIGADYATGVEAMVSTPLLKWWNINLMANLYDYRLEGAYNGREIDTQSFNWNARFSNTFVITPRTKIQFDGMYNSASKTVQGSREGFMFTNFAIRQDFFENKLNATLSVRDVFNTAKFEFESEGPGFKSYAKFDMNSPVVSLTLSYKFNNYKQKMNQRGNGENFENNGENMDMGVGGF
jgi:outer membrane receptor protein involved in Fe transport